MLKILMRNVKYLYENFYEGSISVIFHRLFYTFCVSSKLIIAETSIFRFIIVRCN